MGTRANRNDSFGARQTRRIATEAKSRQALSQAATYQSMLKMSTRRLMVVVACVGVGMAVLRHVLAGPPLLDLILSRAIEHDTVFSIDYSEEKWNSLHRGMTVREVELIIGRPLVKTHLSKQREVWQYTKSPSDSHYLRRNVIFQLGKVQEFDSMFYFD